MKKCIQVLLASIALSTLLASCSPIAIYKYNEDNVKATLKLYPTNRYAYLEHHSGIKTVAKGDYRLTDTSLNMVYPPTVKIPLITQTEPVTKTPQHVNHNEQLINVLDLATGEPIVFATVGFYGQKGRLIAGSETDLTGSTTIPVPNDIVTIEVSKTGYVSTRIDAKEAASNHIRVELGEQRQEPRGCFGFYKPYILEGTFDDGNLVIAGKQFTTMKNNLKKYTSCYCKRPSCREL